MLTSKDILERTGISRATLNNYIAAGLVARPEVMAPAPEHGAAPRIGYFPDDTLDRIRSIQRLKRQGWSLGRIAEHLAGEAAAVAAVAPPAARLAASRERAGLRLELQDAGHPAYLVDERFGLAWRNSAAEGSTLSPIAGLQPGQSVLGHLLGAGSHALLRFHLSAAKERGLGAAQLSAHLDGGETARLREMMDEVRPAGTMPVAHVSLAPTGTLPLRQGFAVHFREHVLFAFSPAPASSQPSPARAARAAPRLAPVAVLVASLHDASALWARLAPHEYFELANEAWAVLDVVFRRHRALLGRHPGEGAIAYFLRDEGEGHLASALGAARAARQAMRDLSRRWQERRQWDVPVAMDFGIDEGQEWVGAIGPDEWRVLGEAAERAEQLSRCGRGGTIFATRGFIGKLPASEQAHLQFAAPRADGARGRAALQTFAPLGAVCPAVPARLAEVPVAEIVDPPAA